jgi:glycosyltransferase involved in cell wall biosynthesis
MRRRAEWSRPRHLRLLRLRRAVGRTRVADAVKRRLRARLPARAPRGSRPPVPATMGSRRDGGTNVVLISHCDFDGNSALHVYAVAQELHRRGFAPAIVVPRNARTVEDLGAPPYPVLAYRDVRRGRLRFPNDDSADLVHAFTPRPHVQELATALCAAHRCPYLVHLEDNEAVVGGIRVDDDAFVAGAAAVTVVVERLLDLKPAAVPGVVLRPGFDEAVLTPQRSREEVRAQLRIGRDELALVYTGNVHEVNLDEVRDLYLAVARLRDDGIDAVLVKTGWNFVHRSRLPGLGDGVRDLGWVARKHVPELLAAADVLVQPGRPGPFNDYRFPSKLPDFLASGRPVVLPRTNIGLQLQDGVEALLLERGDAHEIRERVALLARDPELRTRLGERGREFALRELRWSRTVEPVVELYESIRRGSAARRRESEPANVTRPHLRR